MSLWIRLSTGYFSHRKTIRLEAKIGPDASRIPIRLWTYAADNQPDGDLSKYTAEELAIIVNYKGDANKLLAALIEVGFLDDAPLRIHEWQEHNGFHATFKERAQKAAAARWSKERSRTAEDQKRSDDKRSDDRRGDEASIPPSNASSNASSMSKKAPPLFLREIDKLIADGQEQIRVLENHPDSRDAHGNYKPEVQHAIDGLRKKITELQSQKFGTQIPEHSANHVQPSGKGMGTANEFYAHEYARPGFDRNANTLNEGSAISFTNVGTSKFQPAYPPPAPKEPPKPTDGSAVAPVTSEDWARLKESIDK